jgi:hypothetical protein
VADDDDETHVFLSLGVSNHSTAGFASGEIVIKNIQAAAQKNGHSVGECLRATTTTIALCNTAFQVRDTGAITGIKLMMGSGNIAAGRVRIEGC